MPVSLTVQPDFINLTDIATVRNELMGSPSITADTVYLNYLIAECSQRVVAMAGPNRIQGHPFARCRWSEKFRGRDQAEFNLANAPLAYIDAVYTGAKSENEYSTDGFVIYGVDTGDILLENGTLGSTRWDIHYTAGYFLPDDDRKSVNLEVLADNVYRISSSWPTHLKPGDSVYFDNLAVAGNNGMKTVVSVSGNDLTVAETVTVAADEIGDAYFRNLPGTVERACLTLIQATAAARDRDPAIRELDVKNSVKVILDDQRVIDAVNHELAPFIEASKQSSAGLDPSRGNSPVLVRR